MPSREEVSFKELKEQFEQFANEREWKQFHSPKNLSMALSVEASELLEIFQWQTEESSYQLDEKKKEAVADELADIFLYGTRVAGILDIDIKKAILNKMAKNRLKYPIERGLQIAKELSRK